MRKVTALFGFVTLLASQVLVGCSGDHISHSTHDPALKLGTDSTAQDSMSIEADSMNMATGSMMGGGMMEGGMMGNSTNTTCAQKMPAMHESMLDDTGMMTRDGMGTEVDTAVLQIDSSAVSGAGSEPVSTNYHADHH